MRECLVWSTAVVMLCTLRASAASSTPFQLGDQGGVIVPVFVNGIGPFRMLLDTGSTHSAITEAVAEAVRARPVAQSQVITPAGPALRAVAAVERLDVGPVAVDHLLPSIVSRDAFDRDGRIHGLIGQDVLSGLRYTLDFRERRVEWHDRAASHDGTKLRMEFEHGRFLVALPQDGCTLRLVPDSGAGVFVLFDPRAGAGLDLVERQATVELWSADLTHTAREVRVPQLRVGDRTLRNVRAVTVDRVDRHPSEGDGLLPLHLFDRVTFDGPAQELILR